jgi:transcriptional regulator with XRE-family HTH domain
VAASPAQQRLAAALKRLRARAGISGSELGALLGWTQARVSRSENGARRVSVTEAAAWADATRAPRDLRAELMAMAEDAAADVRSWWNVHAGGLTGRQHEIAALEASAAVIRNCQWVIPGLLQTADYARRAVELANVSGQHDAAAAVAARMRRQEILYDPSRQFEYVLPEAALRLRLSDDPAVMRAQADRLLSVDSLPNVSIAVLPFGVPLPAWPTAFALYEITGQPVVVVETLTEELVIGDEHQVASYRDAFARMRAAAVTGRAAADVITAAMPA